MSAKKPPSINLRASLAVSSPAGLSPGGTGIDAESFLRGDKTRTLPLAHIERNKAAQPRLRLDPECTFYPYKQI